MLSDALSMTMLQVQATFGTSSKSNSSAEWSVRSATVTDRIGEPYSILVELGTKTRTIKAGEMRGQHAWLGIARGRKKQVLRGIVTEVRHGGFDGILHVLGLTIVPAVQLLEHRTTSRIFADQTVAEIVQAVITQVPEPYRREVALNLDDTTFEKREYVVQHQESDLAFLQRLLADEGIWLEFEQPSDEKAPEKLRLTNANALVPPIAEDDKLIATLDREALAHEEAITEFAPSEATLPTQFALRLFNWTHPAVYEAAKHEAKDPANLALPVYEYGGAQAIDYEAKQFKRHDTEQKLKFRHEAVRALQTQYSGESNAVLLAAGRTFSVGDQKYLVTSVTHDIRAVNNTGGAADNASYLNAFTCIPIDVPYRPALRAAPRISGIEHATVVDASGGILAPESGGTGGDIVVDPNQHGRVRVKFHWDDTAPGKGGTTSCWVRSLQMWSGAGWGAQFWPRVGMEVVVAFEGGDPDRPVILGCVYNGLNPPPYADKPTQSGIKTQSSVKRGHYNELRFDDAAGHEQIFTRAQKDYVEQILNNHTTTVGAHHVETVKATQTLTVVGKRAKLVGGETGAGEDNSISGPRFTIVTGPETQCFDDIRHITVAKTDTLVVKDHQKQTIDKGREVTITEADDNLTVSAGNQTTKVKQKFTLLCEGQFAIGQGTLEGSPQNSLVFDKKLFVHTEADFTITNDKSKLYGQDGKLLIESAEEITIKCGASSISLKKDGTIDIKGKTVTIGNQNNNAKFDPAGALINGTKVSSVAVGINEVNGALIKIG